MQRTGVVGQFGDLQRTGVMGASRGSVRGRTRPGAVLVMSWYRGKALTSRKSG